MAFDQNITYRVNVDDSNFQSKLTQMRASLDASMGGLGAGGYSSTMMYGAMGVMGGGGGYGGGGGGLADFGTQIRPITYTPPAIAMQPHFGMYQIQQTLAQAGLGAMGPVGAGVGAAWNNFSRGGFTGLITGPQGIPNQVSSAEYMALSARGFGDRVGDAAAIAGLTAGSVAAQTAVGAGAWAMGASLFSGGLGQFAGGMAASSIATLPLTMAVGKITDLMADNRSLQTSLGAGSFRFMTGSGAEIDPLTGRGMSRRARFNVATAIQGMEMSDLRYGADEYKQILEGGMQFDMFSGTRDVEDFKGKFKGLVENLKTVTATLHTSLKEGIEVIRGMRDMGVTDPSEVTRLTLGSEMRGRMSGRTGMEMMAVGQAGAEIFRGTGVSMERGFELNQMNVQSVRGMLNSGTLSREMVAQAGGENSLAQQMTAGALAAFQTAHGRAAMMANYNPNAGPNGAMNANMMANLAGGNIMGQIAGAAGMGPAALMKFQAHQEDMISAMSPETMQVMNLSLAMGTARMLHSATGADMDTSMRVSMQNMGLSKPVIEANLGLLKQDPTKMRADMDASIANMRTQAGLEDLRNRFNIGKSISNTWGRAMNSVANPLMEMSAQFGEAVDDLSLDLAGAARTNPALLDKSMIARGQALVAGGAGGEAVDITGSWYRNKIGGQTGVAFAEDVVNYGTFDAATKSYSYKGGTFRRFDSAEEARGVKGISFATTGGGAIIGMSTAEVEKTQAFSRAIRKHSRRKRSRRQGGASELRRGRAIPCETWVKR